MDRIKIKLSILSKKRKLEIPIPDSKFDERDTMFARMARKENTFAYNDYYSTNPNLKKRDDHIRSLNPLLEKGSKYFDENITKKASLLFDSIENINIDKSLIDSYMQIFNNSESYDNILKNIILDLGAVSVGYTDLEQNFVYSHKGRLDSNYGTIIEIHHPNTIVFLVEMDYERMQSAPKANIIYESALQYYNAAYISKVIEKLLLELGYSAKAHYDAHYDVILPPLATKAGLGELGRNNILLTNKYGSRVRIGAITTDLPVKHDNPKSIGVDKFCQVCKKCAENCPTRSLSLNGKKNTRGIEKWSTNVDQCYTIWRKYGTDCGICMAVCPFSHKNNIFHNIIRNIVKYFPIFNKWLVSFDNIIYGKAWKIKDK